MAVRRKAAAQVVGTLALALGAVLAAVFFGRFQPAATALLRLARPLAAAVLVLLASLCCGVLAASAARAVVMRLARLREPQPGIAALPELLLVGIPVYGTLLGAISLTGVPLDSTTILVTLLLAVGGGLVIRLRRPAFSVSVSVSDVALLGPPIAIAFLGATTPVASPDELVYKLAVPQAYRLHGGMVEFPLNSHSYFPAGFGLASLGGLVLSGGVAAKLVHLAVYLLTLRVLRRLGDRLDPPAGLWGCAVVAWTPALMLVAGWGWPDWGVIGLLLLSYERWRSFRESGEAVDAITSVLALAGALAARYTALLWLIAFAAAVALDRKRRSQSMARLAVALAAVLIVFGGFFYVRNLLWTGSPFAPFLLPDSPGVDRFRGGSSSGWLALLQGQDILHRDIVDDSLGILLPLSVLLSPLSLRGRGRTFADLFGMGLAQLVVFVTLAPLSRLWMTALVPLALLGASLAVRLQREAGRSLATLLSIGAAVALAGQLLLVGYIFAASYDLGPYVVGRENEAGYRFRTREFARPYDWIARSTSPSSRIFLIGENRTFDLARPAFSAGNLDGPRLSRYLERFPAADAFAREMRRLGVTHLLLHRDWYRVRGAEPAPPLGMLEKEYVVEVGPETNAMLSRFLASRTRLRYRDRAYDVYEVTR
jgi:hypothetical protein